MYLTWLLFCPGIEYKTKTTVTAANIASKTLTCDSGEELKYEKLIIATGARVCSVICHNEFILLCVISGCKARHNSLAGYINRLCV